MIYLNNAATSFPKPPSVVKAMTEAMVRPPASALRSNLRGDGDLLTALRQRLGTLFNISDWERIFFCSSATDAINRVLGGVAWRDVEFSINNHNSVLRPLANSVHRDEERGYDAVVCNHCSNVTGEIADVGRIRKRHRQRHRLFILDAAQSAGCIPVDVDGWGVDILVFTGHKGLFGPMGTGGYYVRRGIDFVPTQFGGTGTDSSVVEYEKGHWEYEVGTLNMPGLAGLKAGVDYVLERGVANILKKEQALMQWFVGALKDTGKVLLYDAPQARANARTNKRQGPVVSFNIKGLRPADVGYILQNTYGITVRTGLHCSPLIHRQLGTAPDGAVRISISDFTTRQELETAAQAINDIANSL